MRVDVGGGNGVSNTEKPIEYAGPTGRERPGEHWNARIIREQNEAKTAQSVMADGITDEMIGKAAELLRAYPGLQLPLSSSAEDVVRLVVAAALAGQTVTPHVCSRCGERVGYMLCDPCQEAFDRTAGRTVVDLPEPTAWRNRLDGDVDIWPIGGWSVTASPDGVGISTSRDGLGGGLGFRDGGQASEIGAALIAADRRLAAKQSTVTGGVL